MKTKSLSLIGAMVCSLTLTMNVSAEQSTDDRATAVPDTPHTRFKTGNNEHNSTPPQQRSTFKNMQELMPTKAIDAGDGPMYRFKKKPPLNLDAIPFEFHNPVTGKRSTQSVAEMLRQTHTDALLVLKNGKLVYEQYFDGQTRRTRHQLNSVTKSLVGLLAAMLVTEGKLQRDAKVIEYIPELKNSAYRDATVGQVLDMTVALRFSEDINDPDSEVTRYMAELGVSPSRRASFGSVRKFLATLKAQERHGENFRYVTPNADVVCWLIERASGKPFEKIFEERLWARIGARRDAYFLVDASGTPSCGGGLNATAEDLAKIGQLLLNNGQFNHRRILPASALRTIRNGGDRELFSRSRDGQGILKGWSYRDLFWVRHNPGGDFAAIGVCGQWIYVAPQDRVVIVKQSNLQAASNDEIDAYALAAFDAVIKALR